MKPSITILERRPNYIKFLVENTTCHFMNYFRRVIKRDVPTLAIEDVFIVENTTVYDGERIAHILGLIPLKVSIRKLMKRYKTIECTLEKCETAEELYKKIASSTHHPIERIERDNTLTIKATIPSDEAKELAKTVKEAIRESGLKKVKPVSRAPTIEELMKVVKVRIDLTAENSGSGKKILTVYSGDMEINDPAVKLVSKKIPIIKLAPGQKLVFEAIAVLGTGREHAKWQPVSICAYQYAPIIEIDNALCTGCARCVEMCPDKVLKMQNGTLVIENALNCSLCESCVEICDVGAINVDSDPTKIIFQCEGIGNLDLDEVLSLALDIMDSQIKNFKELVESEVK